MIELPDGKISRTLPEQVGFLTKEVRRIYRFLDGINVQDNVVAVDNIATPLNAEELVIVNRDVAFIVYSGQLYIKKSVSGSTAYFDVVFSITAGTTITFNSSEIQVNLSNGGMSLVSNSPVTYSKAQIDTLLSAKADITYVDAQLASGLALKANLAGANFTGGITSPSIIESMSGYSATTFTPATMTIQNTYVGTVKNGNKITFVWFGTLTPTTVESNYKNVIQFNIPADVGAKIYPYSLGAFDNIVYATLVNGYSNLTTVSDVYFVLRKVANNNLTLQVRDGNLTANTTYYCRFEATFLLGDNLAS